MRARTLLLCFFVMQTLTIWAEDYEVSSPDGHLKATVSLAEGKLSYTDRKSVV